MGEQVRSISIIQGWRANAERRYKENRPGKWWVFGEWVIMGLIAGFFIPYWFGMVHNPHSRARIDEFFAKTKFDGSLRNTLFNETLLLSYDYSLQ